MTVIRRILFGLDRLPRTIALDDLRLPGVTVGAEMLRLNTEPLPPDVTPPGVGEHTARVVAAIDWLSSLCGDYAPLRRQFIRVYFSFLATHIAEHRAELVDQLKRYDGLYSPDDWIWSAPRPLPRAWVPAGDRKIPAEIVFWDGTQSIAIELASRDTERQAALRAAGVTVCRIETAHLAADPVHLGDLLPGAFREFWRGQKLPASPFRRRIPHGVVREAKG